MASVQLSASERERLRSEAAECARAAESQGDGWAANEAWRRHRLMTDGGRDPDELLTEGTALSRAVLAIARTAAGRSA